MNNKTFTISLVFFLVTLMGVASLASRGNPIVVKTNLENLPMEISGYRAQKDSFSESVIQELDANLHVYRHYKNDQGKQTNLYIGYYGTAKGGRTPHNPYACLPGAGWALIDTAQINLQADYLDNKENVNYILSKRGDVYNVVIHWYQSRETKVIGSGLEQNIQRFLGRVLYNRNDGAFVRISTVIKNRNKIPETKERLKDFSEEVLQLLPKYWPVEKNKAKVE